MRRYVLSLAVLALVFGVAAQAHASLVGDTVEIEFVISSSPGLFGPPGTPTVAEGPDENPFSQSLGPATISADLEASSISINFGAIFGSTFFGTVPFIGPEFSGLDWFGMPDGEIIGFLLDTNISGLTDSRVFPSVADALIASGSGTAGPHSLAVNFSDLMGITDNSFVDITLLLVSHPISDLGSQPIPEPGTLLLIGSGLVGLGVGARRRNHRK